jgi:hypothetical protein
MLRRFVIAHEQSNVTHAGGGIGFDHIGAVFYRLMAIELKPGVLNPS